MTLDVKTDSYRWIILLLYVALTLCNSLFWITFAPITDLTQAYIGGDGTYNNVTAVNMLSNIFLIVYFPCTLLTNLWRKRYGLKTSLLICGFLTVLGAIFRFVPTLFRSSLSSCVVYVFLFLGQLVAAIAQPFFCNIPSGISTAWFPDSERDIATAIGSVASTAGNAIGLLLPVYFVSDDKSSVKDSYGLSTLLGIELLVCVAAQVLFYFFFESAPYHPPSLADRHNRESASNLRLTNLNSVSYNSIEKSDDRFMAVSLHENPPLSTLPTSSLHELSSELSELFQNRNYVLLFVVFSLSLGFFCAIQILLFQIIEPFGYTNNDAGVLGSAMVAFGVLGAMVASVCMTWLKTHGSIFKAFQTLTFMSVVIFTYSLKPNQFESLLAATSFLGFCISPLLLINMELCAEITYPIAEDVSFGMLAVGCNIVGSVLVFILQYLNGLPPVAVSFPAAGAGGGGDRGYGVVYMSPSSLFVQGLFLFITVLCFFFNAQYKRRYLSMIKT